MSEPIKVGDLVVVVKPRLVCGCTDDLGRTFQVASFFPVHVSRRCPNCGWSGMIPGTNAIAAGRGFSVFSVPIERLKRIPPLGELEGQPTHEDMKEPA